MTHNEMRAAVMLSLLLNVGPKPKKEQGGKA